MRRCRRLDIFFGAAVIFLALLCGVDCCAADAPDTAGLITRGAKIRTEKDGTPVDLYLPPTAILTVDDWQAIGKLRTLKNLYSNAKGVPLNDETALALAHLDKLEKLFANGAELSDDGFKAFEGLSSLKTFGLDHWGWKTAGKGNFGAGLSHLASCTHLESVRLGGCRADNHAPEALAQVKSLQSVDFQHCYAVTDDGMAALRALPNLHIVKLSPQFSTRITDASLVALGGIKTLEEIDINETWLTYEKGFSHLKDLTALKKIVLNKVLASDDEIAKLKADHPGADVQWTKPDDATIAKMKDTFEKSRAKEGKKAT